MAKRRKKIKPVVKRKLRSEAGNKCANPGCSNWRVHIHHIKHWIVYQTDDEKEMIAVCPACHDAIHYGKLEISDDTLFGWKNIYRALTTVDSHLYIEPSAELKLLTGTIAISTSNQEALVFELSDQNKLKFRILDNDIMMLNSNVSDLMGTEVLRVVDNHIRVKNDDEVIYEQVPGHVRISAPTSKKYIPDWVITKIRIQENNYGMSGNVIILDLKVLKPGVVRVQGLWIEDDIAVIITKERLSFLTAHMHQPLSLVGEGEGSVLKYCGPINTALFGFKNKKDGALKI